MTPAELAEELLRPDTDLVLVGEVGRDFTTAERETLAVALRLAEKVNTLDGDVKGIAVLTCDYRSARKRLASNAP